MPAELLPFLIASLLIELTPGPNMTWLAIVALTEGRGKGLQAVAGVASGLALLGLLGALGVSQLVQSSTLLYEVLRWAGILFLVYLAWEGYVDADGEEEETATKQYFLRGFISNLLNPKAAIFYITVLPAFMKNTQSALSDALVLTAGYVLVATAIHAGIVLMAAQIRPLMAHPDRSRHMRKALSILLFFVAVWFAWTTAR